MDKLLRLPDVVELTGISANTLRYWRHIGKGPRSGRLGRRIVYRESDIQAWLDASFEDAGA